MIENNIILIPSTPTDCPLGNVFSNIFVISSTTERMQGNDVVWDFCNVMTIHPFLFSSLSLYKKVSNKNITCINKRKCIEQQMEDAHFDSSFKIDLQETAKTLFSYQEKNFLPICKYPANDDSIQQALQSIIQKQSKAENIATPLSYVMGEIICNVIQHAACCDVYFSSFFEGNTIDICIADMGIGIYGSYVKAGKYLSDISDNEAEALRLANEGYSTKNLPMAENRGFGISTSRNMVVKGLGGTFSILSGNALQLSSPDKEDVFIRLPQGVEWQGTMVFIQLPNKAGTEFKYTDFLE